MRDNTIVQSLAALRAELKAEIGLVARMADSTQKAHLLLTMAVQEAGLVTAEHIRRATIKFRWKMRKQVRAARAAAAKPRIIKPEVI